LISRNVNCNFICNRTAVRDPLHKDIYAYLAKYL
jgi:hypothetical protein